MLPKCFIFSVPARARTVDPLIKSFFTLIFGYLWLFAVTCNVLIFILLIHLKH